MDRHGPRTQILHASTAHHFDRVRELFREYALELNADLCFQSFETELATLPGKYAPPAGQLWLATHADNPIGCIALRPIDPCTCEMKRLYVRPAHRGHGLARTLAVLCLAAARELGYSRMLLDTLDRLQPALKLYRSLGFRPTSAYYSNPLPGVIYLERQLSGHIRPATNADMPAIRSLVFTTLAEYGLRPDPATTDADLADIEQYYFRRAGHFSVLTGPDGDIIACAGLYPIAPGHCELRKMYLARAHRGQGLGRSLLETAIAQAHRLGFHHITLETANVLKEAIALYQHYGFKPYTPSHLAARCDQAYELTLLH